MRTLYPSGPALEQAQRLYIATENPETWVAGGARRVPLARCHDEKIRNAHAESQRRRGLGEDDKPSVLSAFSAPLREITCREFLRWWLRAHPGVPSGHLRSGSTARPTATPPTQARMYEDVRKQLLPSPPRLS